MPALDVDYIAYEGAMVIKPSAQWQAATNQLFIDWKQTLGINRLYERFDVIYLFVAETEQAALLNAAKRSHDATNNGMTFASRVGLQGDGAADYINSNYNPSTQAVTFGLNNALMGLHSRTATLIASAQDMGATTRAILQCYYTGGATNIALNQVSGISGTTVGTGEGLFLGNRNGTALSLYHNGTEELSTTNSPSSVPNFNIFIGARNSSGSPILFSPRMFAGVFIGSDMTADEHAAFYTIWAEYLETIATEEPPVYDPDIPVVGTNSVVQIFDRTGVPIGEVLPEIDFVSWRRNEIGQAVFTLAKTDPKVNDTFLRAQNRVLITFDNGLPPWGGIMQPDFVIDHDTIKVKALTAESLLSRRLTDRGRYFNQQTVGVIASALITEANAVLPLGIELGTVWSGGSHHSPEYHYKDLFTIFRDSLFKRLSDADFYTEPIVQADGRLIFRLHVVERRGRNMTGAALHQGLNIVDPTRLAYTGPIINRWVIVGDGQGWGSDRPVAVAEDMDSIARYGNLESSEIHQGVVNPETLQVTASNLLSGTAWPRVILDLTAVDLPPATFEQYDIGDNLPVELPDYGIGSSFVGAATVQARAFYPKDGRLNLVLEATAAA